MKTPLLNAILTASFFVFAGTQAVSADDEMQSWKDALRSKIATSKNYPRTALEDGIEGTVRLRLKFEKNGGIQGAEIVGKSGNQALDRSALQLALRINDMPALPEGREQMSMIIPMKFQIKDKG